MFFSKIKLSMIIALTIALLLTGCSGQPAESDGVDHPPEPQLEKIKVFTSFYPYYDFALTVGGELVEVTSIVPASTEPHSFEPTPRILAELEKAEVFIYNGLEFEPWVDGVLELLSGKDIKIINASEGLDLISLEDHDHDHDDHDHDDHDHDHDEDEDEDHDHHHGEFDPHIWLDPMNAAKIAERIKDALSTVSSDNTDVFEENYSSFKAQLEELDVAFSKELEGIPSEDRKIIVSHSAFAYLARRYGIEEISVAGTSPHAEPTPAKLAELSKLAKAYNIKHIFFEVLANPKTAEVLSKEANLEPLVLYNMEGLTDEQQRTGEDYISLMYKNIESLKKALVK